MSEIMEWGLTWSAWKDYLPSGLIIAHVIGGSESSRIAHASSLWMTSPSRLHACPIHQRIRSAYAMLRGKGVQEFRGEWEEAITSEPVYVEMSLSSSQLKL